jgi:hypothetical protein
MLTALILLLAAVDFEPEYEITAPPKDEAVVVSGPIDESPVAAPLPNSNVVPEGRQSTDETYQQNLDGTQTPENRPASPYRIPLTILTAVVCGLLFLFFRQTE